MIYVKFTKSGDTEVYREEYNNLTVNQALWKTKQAHGRDIEIVTVGATGPGIKSGWEPDPSWPIIAVPKRQRKTFFGRYIN
jgi:hypothetical protein